MNQLYSSQAASNYCTSISPNYSTPSCIKLSIYVASPSSSPTIIYANNSATCTASSPSSSIKGFVNANGFCVAALLHVDE
jgi:hypothetical protein